MKACRYLLLFILFGFSNASLPATLNVSNTPLFLTQDVPPLTLIIMGRDHKLYYEAYNNVTDLDGDGVLDIRFKPDITYFGYFDSEKCYSYSSSYFVPIGATSGSGKTCSGTWSGNFLNYLTTSRMDALRKVLYGGYRSTDSTTSTILERSYIPQDAHSWGMEYTSTAVDGYDLSKYTPLSIPVPPNRTLFANVTLLTDGAQHPRLRIAQNIPYRVWEWVSIERPVAGNRVQNGDSGPNISGQIVDYYVRVKVCDENVGLETNCQLYPNGKYKPIGLLQQFGENNAMYFGLLTGSYNKNLEGGVLRKNIGSISDEIDINTGQFTGVVGIIRTINNLRFTLFGGGYVHDCTSPLGSWITTRPINNGECRMWGNPIAEMMYEGLRYFAGKGSPTGTFHTTGGTDGTLNLPTPAWNNPYAPPNPWCAKPNMLVISDINPSYDSNSVPGSYFNGFSGDLTGFNAQALGNTIWIHEMGGAGNYFIGQSGANYDGAPTSKTVTSFGNIRGLSPEEPTKEGSYYSASAAYYGLLNDINPAEGEQKVYTYAIAIASPLPEIKIAVGGNTVTLIPFAKSAGGCLGVDGTEGLFQPTNTIVDFYVESLSATSGVFRINFEDVEQGADHDMDAIVKYTYTVIGNTVRIDLESIYAAGCIIQHMGYVISGTTEDGAYLQVRDLDTAEGSDPDYFLDFPVSTDPLPTISTKTFTVGSATAKLIKNPLWYAAKWGSFNDLNNNNIPDQVKEYDTNNDGVPDNYFLVTNALTLGDKLANAFNRILGRTGTFSSAALSSGFLNTETKLYQAIFSSSDWSGQLLAFNINPNNGEIDTSGGGPSGSEWDAGQILTTQNWNTGRQIITYKPSNGKGIKFRWPTNSASPSATELDISQINNLNYSFESASVDGQGELRLRYIRGDTSDEKQNGGNFRNRTTILGDIISSDPLIVGSPAYAYPDEFTDGSETPYTNFRVSKYNRTKMLYVGANDGMLHAFDAESGVEIMAYVPSKVFNNLPHLTNPEYTHHYYVNGSPNAVDAFFNGAWHTVLTSGLAQGGQAVFALDVTDPSGLTEGGAENLVLWEFTDINDSDLGFTFSKPSIVRMANGEWAAVFGNGYNNTFSDANISSTGNAVLYIVNISTGVLIKKFDTKHGIASDPLGLARPNGLSSPAVIDVNGDYVADYIYAGDLFGNLWKFDVSGSNKNQWDFSFKQGSTPQPFFIAEDASGNRQPITAQPTVSRISASFNVLQVYIGTGKYFEVGDTSDTSIQTFYAIRDDTSNQVQRSQLLEQTILSQADGMRVVSQNVLIPASHKGWYIDLIYNNVQEGERVIRKAIYRHNKIIFTTIVPNSDPCGYGGTSWLMEMNALDGRRLNYTVFDINKDGHFNASDDVIYDDETVPVSGLQSTVGLVASPAILNAGKKEYKYLPGSSGGIQTTGENPGQNVTGRQSWRQVQ